MKDLLELVSEWREAQAKGDTAALQQIFADEFTNADENGKAYSKAEWISVFKGGDPTLKSWTISDTKLVLAGDTATMTYSIHLNYTKGRDKRARNTDTFIKRDGRWQVVSSKSTLTK